MTSDHPGVGISREILPFGNKFFSPGLSNKVHLYDNDLCKVFLIKMFLLYTNEKSSMKMTSVSLLFEVF